MKNIKKVILLVIVLLSMDVFYSCSSARWGTDAGVNVTWGPNGPRVRPHVDFNVFNGGRL
jgi:hypothetical protein